MTQTLVCLASLIVVTNALASEVVPEWKLVHKMGDVEVYTRTIPGQSVASLKGSGIVKASAARVAQVLLDCQRATTWVDSLAESHVVRHTSSHSYLEYNRVAMPLLVEDR